MPTRIIRGTIRTPTGDPWSSFALDFTVTPSTYTMTAQYPYDTHEVVTGEDGTFSVELATGISYEVALRSAFVVTRSGTRYPPGSRFTVVIPEGDNPITLEELRALNQPPPSVPAIIDIVEGKADREHTHVIGDVDGLQGALDNAGGGGPGGPARWGSITGDIGDQGDLQAALGTKAETDHTHVIGEVDDLQALLGAKADASALGTAALADTDAFATAAQGATADTAVQPDDLGEVATSNQYGDLDGIPDTFSPTPHAHAIADVNGLQDVLDDAGGGEPGPGVAAGGGTGQVLAKASEDDYDTAWVDPPEGGGGGATAWGDIAGDLADQTDLQDALDDKAGADHQHLGNTPESVVIGEGASARDSNNTGRQVVIGTNSEVSGRNSVAIGRRTSTSGFESTAVGSFCRSSMGGVAVGYSARSDASSTVSIGRGSTATGQRSIAIGRNSTSGTVDTAVIAANDLDVQRSIGSGETRIALCSPNGTKYWLSVTDDGELAVTPA